MDKFTEFVLEHEGEEVEALVLQKGRWPDIDVAKAADTIEGRRRMRGKAPSWWECVEVVYPSRLCVEQCSSEAVCEIKAEIISAMLSGREADGKGSNDSVRKTVDNEKKIGLGDGRDLKMKGLRLADLTGGLGVDSWMFSKMAERVLYVERDSVLTEAARHNFTVLGCENIEVVNAEVSPEGFVEVSGEAGGSMGFSDSVNGDGGKADGWTTLKKFAPDIIYLDPSRRSEGGEKVFKLEDCRPNILELRDKLLEMAELVVVKLSPMADIDEVVRQLGPCCLRADVLSVDGECKEVLVTMERDYQREGMIWANCGKRGSFAFFRSDETAAVPHYLSLTKSENPSETSTPTQNSKISTQTDIHHPTQKSKPHTAKPTDFSSLVGKILLEPDKAVMKAGPFKLLSATFGLTKLDVSTHYYIDGTNTSESNDIYGDSASEEYGETCEGDVSEGDGVISGETKKEGDGFWDNGNDRAEKIGELFRRFRILRVEPLNKKTLRAVGQDYPNAEVTARNIPLSSDELRKRLAVGSSKRDNHPSKNTNEPLDRHSDTIHIFGLRSGGENLLFVTEKI
ncbi:MAG: class I SAM-dependent methyltransferase [Bacteroidales bacterium]|nr:class I SAM-dependent methyltransferase [Bacteroidales bacterium]